MRNACLILLEDGRVVWRGKQAALFSEICGWATHIGSTAHWERHLSGSETLAAFGATTAENLPTVLRCHAGAKAVSALALEYAGLECSFHVTGP